MHPGGGWGQGEGGQRLSLMCDDIERTVEELEAKGVEFTTPVTEQDWGRIAMLLVPGLGEVVVRADPPEPARGRRALTRRAPPTGRSGCAAWRSGGRKSS